LKACFHKGTTSNKNNPKGWFEGLQGAQSGITACPDFREAKRVIPLSPLDDEAAGTSKLKLFEKNIAK
jgi:hypothetical protein